MISTIQFVRCPALNIIWTCIIMWKQCRSNHALYTFKLYINLKHLKLKDCVIYNIYYMYYCISICCVRWQVNIASSLELSVLLQPSKYKLKGLGYKWLVQLSPGKRQSRTGESYHFLMIIRTAYLYHHLKWFSF